MPAAAQLKNLEGNTARRTTECHRRLSQLRWLSGEADKAFLTTT